MPERPHAVLTLVEAPDAPAGAVDATRRWALAFPDGRLRFPGIARTEAAAVLDALARLDPDGWDDALVAITLPVVLSDGAGPHLLDAAGRITLALGVHPAIAGARVAMGEARPRHRVGLVAPVGEGPLWRWLAAREVDADGRVAALDALDAAPDLAAASRWAGADRG
jgi:hypothetical protein